MKNKLFILFFAFISMLFMSTGCADKKDDGEILTTATPAIAVEKKAIVLGDISDDPAEVIEGTQPLADYLANQLEDVGITVGEVKIVQSADEMSKMLANGEVDLYFDSVYPATLVSDASGGQVILRRWRYGVEKYQSVIFASVSSGITSIDDLHGHLIAFDNQFSTSGFVLPAVYLDGQGINLIGKENYNAAVGENELGFVFSFDDENTIQWILKGFVDVAATDDYYFDQIFTDEIRANLVELVRTDFVPRQVVVASPKMDADTLAAVIEALLTVHETEAGLAALDPFQTSKFDRFPEGIEVASDHMRNMVDIIESIPLP